MFLICGFIYLFCIIWNISVTLLLTHMDFINDEDVNDIVMILAIFPITAPLYTCTITVGLISYIINFIIDTIIKLFSK